MAIHSPNEWAFWEKSIRTTCSGDWNKRRPIGTRPIVGRMDASEVNHAIEVLAKIVEEQDLPPKMLVVHRFTRNMLTNAEQIRLDPRVQVVIDMDGYGPPANKMAAYKWFVVRHPVQYTG